MTEAAEAIEALATDRPTVVEQTLRPAEVTSTTFGYFSWGTADPALRDVKLSIPLSAGSIAATLGSTDAASFTPGEKAPRPFAGDLIRAGATGVGANVAEPYLRSSIRPQVLFPAYLGGLPLADAFYRALPHLGWQNLSNFGIVPLEFVDPGDHDRIAQGDELSVEGLREALRNGGPNGSRVTVRNETQGHDIAAQHTLSERQVDILLAGGVVNYFKSRL
jgi:hypothetical protein